MEPLKRRKGINMNTITNSLDNVVTLIGSMDEMDQLEVAQRAIVEARKKILARKAKTFAVGDRVTWKSELGRTLEGTVTKLNLRTIVVVTDVKLSYTLLPTIVTKL